MSDSAVPAATVEDSKFPRLLRKYRDIEHNSSGDVEIWCVEIEYPPDTPDGQYQLWISGKYKKDITSEVEKRLKEQLPLA